jgi:hypothetical protein
MTADTRCRRELLLSRESEILDDCMAVVRRLENGPLLESAMLLTEAMVAARAGHHCNQLRGQAGVRARSGDRRVCVKNVGAIGFCLVERLRWLRTTQPDGKVAGRHGHHHGRDARNAEVRAVTSLDVRLSARRRSPSDAAHATRRTPPEQPHPEDDLGCLQICRTPTAGCATRM